MAPGTDKGAESRIHQGNGNVADIAARARRLLTEHFTGMTADRRQHVLDDAPALAEGGRLILLLDGLNEIPSAQRSAKGAAIRAYLKGLPRGTPVVVSCRGDDYVGDLDLGLPHRSRDSYP